jgi:hypothetical protein
MTKRKADIIAAIIMITLSIALCLLIPTEIEVVGSTVGMTARFFPYVIVLGILGASVFLLIGSIKSNDKRNDDVLPKLDKNERFRVAGLIVIVFGYILLLHAIGYIASTPIAIAVFMRYYGMKRLSIILLASTVLTISLYLVFTTLMGVILPEGELFR